MLCVVVGKLHNTHKYVLNWHNEFMKSRSRKYQSVRAEMMSSFQASWLESYLIALLILSFCTVAKCSNTPDGIKNGYVKYSQNPAPQGHYPEHTTATITCDEGYILSGNNITTCQNDGTWSNLSSCESEPLSQLEGHFPCVRYRAT